MVHQYGLHWPFFFWKWRSQVNRGQPFIVTIYTIRLRRYFYFRSSSDTGNLNHNFPYQIESKVLKKSLWEEKEEEEEEGRNKRNERAKYSLERNSIISKAEARFLLDRKLKFEYFESYWTHLTKRRQCNLKLITTMISDGIRRRCLSEIKIFLNTFIAQHVK